MALQQGDVSEDRYGLEYHGLHNLLSVRWNPSTPALYEEAVRRREGIFSHLGPLVVRTGERTGRSAKDKFIVREGSSEDRIWWSGDNQPIDEVHFDAIHRRLTAYLEGRDVFVQDCFAAADPTHQRRLRVITETAWHSLFARNLFIQRPSGDPGGQHPEIVVIHVPGFRADPEIDQTRSDAFVLVHFGRHLVLIGGTAYAGEIKKSVFTMMNFLLPSEEVLSMHCAANMGSDGSTALFFGLSGTGKTSLSADSRRTLIGDDEHGWGDQGVFNIEGGCYAKMIHLSPDQEPELYDTSRRFGTVLENVAIDSATRRLDLDDDSLTENTRGAYPLSHIANASRTGIGGPPKHVVFITADALGVLPPIARLTPEQAMYHFLSGYTAKVAGTELGVAEPQATFSACFGAPFMPLHPGVYADLLRDRILKDGPSVWLLNTGWTGGPYGIGHRMPIAQTRAMLNAAIEGKLDDIPFHTEPFFGLQIPQRCPDVPDELLAPRNTWPDAGAYDAQARKLAALFRENFLQFEGNAPPEVVAAGPPAATMDRSR